jgi:hypothetical protein
MSRRLATFRAVLSCVVVACCATEIAACSALTDVGNLSSEAASPGGAGGSRGGASGAGGGGGGGGGGQLGGGNAGAGGTTGGSTSGSAGAAGVAGGGSAGASGGAAGAGGDGGAGLGGAMAGAGAGAGTGGAAGGGGTAGAAAGSSGTGGSAGSAGSGTVVPCDNDVVGDGIFVSPSGTQGADGSAKNPVRSIAAALDLAVVQKKTTIYLEEGAYGEGVVLDASFGRPVLIDGGWRRSSTGAWQRLCGDTAQTTIIQSPTGRALQVTNSSGLVRVRHLVLSTAVDLPSPGRSHYGVFATGTTETPVSLEFEDVIFAPTFGEAGDAAPDASPANTLVCDGHSDCGNGNDGADGNIANVGLPAKGSFGDAGYLAPAPIDGQKGTAGKNGKASATSGGVTYQDCEIDCVSPAPCSTIVGPKQVPGGTCGCGGEGGKGGPGGRAGGASVGIFASGSVTVKVLASVVRPAGGGAGSAPGKPATGGNGSDGTATPAICCAATCTDLGDGVCTYAEQNPCPPGAVRPGLEAGMLGGDGGDGSNGRGGVGGPSIGVLTRAGAAANVGESVLLIQGPAGPAGGTDGVAGDSKPFLNLP